MRTYCAGRKLLDLGAGKPGKRVCDNGELHVWQVAVCGMWCEALGCVFVSHSDVHSEVLTKPREDTSECEKCSRQKRIATLRGRWKKGKSDTAAQRTRREGRSRHLMVC